MPIPIIDTTIQIGSGSRLEKRAMKNEPSDEPDRGQALLQPVLELRRAELGIENGSSRTFHSPNEKNMKRADDEQRAEDRRPEQRRQARLAGSRR